jgi:predicted nucleic acid-binding protein
MTIALLDTSVAIALKQPGERRPDLTPFQHVFVSSLTYSELRMGLSLGTSAERTRRQDALDDLSTIFGEGVPYDDAAAVLYGRIVRIAMVQGGAARSHTIDRMIAAVAASRGLVLATRSAADLLGLEEIVRVIEV